MNRRTELSMATLQLYRMEKILLINTLFPKSTWIFLNSKDQLKYITSVHTILFEYFFVNF